jgi:hypothetical protein
LRHNLSGPRGLRDVPTRQKAGHHRLDIENGRAVDCVQTLNIQGCFDNFENPANGYANSIWPSGTALRENSNLRPIRSPARVPRIIGYIVRRNPVEQENDLGMAECIQAEQCLRLKLATI